MDKQRSCLARLAPFHKKPRNVTDQAQVRRVVCHITGRQTWLHAEKARVHPLALIEDYFDDAGNPFAHYCIDPWGTMIQIALETEQPWAHGWAAFGGRKGLEEKLFKGDLVVPSWWLQQWGYLGHGPTALVPPRLGGGNDESVAIEFIQYGNQFLLTEAQYLVGHILLRDITTRHGIHLEWSAAGRFNDNLSGILGHEDLNPWERGDAKGGWDPGALRESPRFCWTCMLDLGAHVTDSGRSCGLVLATPIKPDWLQKIEDRTPI